MSDQKEPLTELEESRIVLAALRTYSDLSVESCTDMALSDKERAWYLAEVEKADHLIELYQRERSMLGG